MIRLLATIGRYLPSTGMLWGAYLALGWVYFEWWVAAPVTIAVLLLDLSARESARCVAKAREDIAFERGRQDMIDRLSIFPGDE